MPALRQRDIGVLGMKSMADGNILKSKTVSAIDCLHFAMTLPTTVVITGIERMDILKQALTAVRTFKPLRGQQVAALLARTKEAALTGRYELFKTTPQFDGTARQPEWLGG